MWCHVIMIMLSKGSTKHTHQSTTNKKGNFNIYIKIYTIATELVAYGFSSYGRDSNDIKMTALTETVHTISQTQILLNISNSQLFFTILHMYMCDSKCGSTLPPFELSIICAWGVGAGRKVIKTFRLL